MDLKDKLLSSFLAFEDGRDVNNYVHDIRSEAIKAFEEQGFPTKKQEAWKYTSLNSVLKQDYSMNVVVYISTIFKSQERRQQFIF